MAKNDYISHKATGHAHLSKFWTRERQNQYNHWYYLHHPEKWGRLAADAAKGAYDKFQNSEAGRVARDAADDWNNSRTKKHVDNAVGAASNYVKNTNAYKTASRYASDAAKDWNESKTKQNLITGARNAKAATDLGIIKAEGQAHKLAQNARYAANYRIGQGKKAVGNAVNAATDAVGYAGRRGRQKLNQAGTAVRGAGRSVVGGATIAANNVKNKARTTANGAIKEAKRLKNKAWIKGTQARIQATHDLKNAADYTARRARQKANQASTAANHAKNSVKNTARIVGNNVKNRTRTTANNIKKEAKRLKNKTWIKATQARIQATHDAKKTVSNIKQSAKQNAVKAGGFAKMRVRDVKNAGKGVISAVKRTARSAYKTATDAGSSALKKGQDILTGIFGKKKTSEKKKK